jgi:hypothetical protein
MAQLMITSKWKYFSAVGGDFQHGVLPRADVGRPAFGLEHNPA